MCAMKNSEHLTYKSNFTNFHQYRSLKVPHDIPSLKQRVRSADKNRISMIQNYCQNLATKKDQGIHKIEPVKEYESNMWFDFFHKFIYCSIYKVRKRKLFKYGNMINQI